MFAFAFSRANSAILCFAALALLNPLITCAVSTVATDQGPPIAGEPSGGPKLGLSISSVDAFYNALLDPRAWTLHTQATTISQEHPAIHSPYRGPLSLSPDSEGRTSFTTTEFIGRRLWSGASFFFNPEIIAGQGFSRTVGIAGFPNGEIYRVDDPGFKAVLSRLYVQQAWALSKETLHVDSDQNQFAGEVAVERLTFVVGKFSLTDFFDINAYSHDPRTQFMNWALFANGAWDYASDTRGYTWGIYGEYNRKRWAIRTASTLEPRQANQLTLEKRVGRARADMIEGEWRYHLGTQPGKLRAISFMNHAHMGSYEDAVTESPNAPDVIQTRDYRLKYGFGLNLEQQIDQDLGFFSRLGWNDGKTETWAFSEIDHTAAAGVSLTGRRWGRTEDQVGFAILANGLSAEHRNYLSHGGVGFLIGDGALNYAPEQIVETYYAFHCWRYLTLTADIQGVKNPAYNADRGPVLIFSERVHIQF